jgi:hypothetical protein
MLKIPILLHHQMPDEVSPLKVCELMYRNLEFVSINNISNVNLRYMHGG